MKDTMGNPDKSIGTGIRFLPPLQSHDYRAQPFFVFSFKPFLYHPFALLRLKKGKEKHYKERAR
jgi:hypothetical protein